MELGGRTWIRVLRDPCVAVGGLLLAVAGILYLDPPLPPETLWGLVHVALIGLATVAVFVGIGRLSDRDERAFWAWIGVSCVLWLGTEVLHQWAQADTEVLWALMVSDTFYLLTYLAWFIAIDYHPGQGRRERAGSSTAVRRTASAGNTLFLLCCVAYFVLIPLSVSGADVFSYTLTGLAFALLDFLLLVRIWKLRAAARTRRWRTIQTGLAIAAFLWFATDLIQALIEAGIVVMPFGTAADFLWFSPFVALILSARLKNELPVEAAPGSGTDGSETRSGLSAEPGVLLAYALLLPLLHLALDAADLLNPETRAVRGVLVLYSGLGLILLAFFQQRALERQRRSLESRVSTLVTHEQALEIQKMEALGRLAGGVAHDFNNLLTVIHGYASLLQRRPGTAEQVRERASAILGAAQRGASLAGQLLAFGRRQSLEPRLIDLTHEVRQQAEMLRRVIGEDVHLDLELPEADDPPAEVNVDPGKLTQVLMNLTINARDAMPQSGGVVRLSVRSCRVGARSATDDLPPGDYCVLEVQDAGCGMDEETRAKIFEPFFTTRDRGTGLGLATVYGIVKQSGGHLRVSSEVGVGTTFEIFLPRAGTPSTAEAHAGPAPTIRGKTNELVLVVEDDPDVRRLARDLLKADGYRVLCAANGLEALAVSEGEDETIGVLLTDIVMPGMTGPELARRVLRLRPETKVVFMSGYPADNLLDRGLVDSDTLEPIEGYLQKPFDPAALQRRVREALASA